MRNFRSAVLVLMALALPATAYAQARSTITGQVTDAGGQPLVGATVDIPTLRLGGTTDERGRFAIGNVPAGTHTLRIQMIGYRQMTREVTVVAGGTTPVTIALGVDPLRLDELVAVGYGTERRRNVSGAVSSLKTEAVREVPATSVTQVLQGRTPGVQITQNSGTPGGANTVRIRGSSSISGGNEPLYVVDGVPANQGNFSRLAGISFGGQDIDAISDLSHAEIERIEVLKDASAAAIYGSRASNGVILITTKRGMSQRPEISFGTYYGTQKDWRRIDLLDAAQYQEIYTEGCRNRYGDAGLAGCISYTDDNAASRVEMVRGVNTDWLSEVMQSSPVSNIEGSVRGGSEKVRYFVSGGFVSEGGTIKVQDFERFNGRINLDYEPANRLTLGTNVGLARSLWHRARSDNTIYSAWSNAMANPPTQPVYDDAGDYFVTLYSNPVGMNEEAEAEERSIRILGNAFANYNLFQGIDARVSVGLDNLTLRSRTWDSPTFAQGPWGSSGGMAESANDFVNKLTYEGTVNFNRVLAERHEVSGVVGASYEDNVEQGERVRGINFPTEFFKYVTSAATVNSGTSLRNDWGLESYFGRLSYTFADRVTATFNVRRDGSSRFGTNNRFGTFPSASVMWRVGEEQFIKNRGFISNLAVRASYGITGNQQALGNFASRGLFSGGWNYLDNPGIAPSQLANPDLRWEKTKQSNFGADIAFFNDRLGFVVDVYNKRTDDLLVSRPVPRTSGFTSVWSNVGSMENRGFEVAMTANLVRGNARSFNWTTNLSLAKNKNKVLDLYNLPGQDPQPISSGFASRVEEGKPLGFFYGYVVEGIFQNYDEIANHARQVTHSDPRRATAPGDLMFKDVNGRDANGKLTGQPDGVINADDREMIGSPWPDLEGGITNTLSFGPLDLTAFVSFSLGNDIYNANRIYMDQYGSGGDNHSTRAMDRWRPDNTNTTEPRAVWGDPNQNTRTSTRFIEDGSFWRLKNLILGYALPSSLASRGGFRSARVYVQGQNVFTVTDYTGFDPEVNYSGLSSIARGTDFYTIPQTRKWTVGMNVTF